MDKIKYTGSSLKECIEEASKAFGVKKDKLKYEVIEEKKGFFKKKVSILVNVLAMNEIKDVEKSKKVKVQENNGSVTVQNGKIIVKDPKNNGEFAMLIPSSQVKLIIDGEEKTSKTYIKNENKIQIIIEEGPIAQRKLDIAISPSCIEAYVTIKYTSKIIKILKDMPESKTITLTTEKGDEEYPTKYTREELLSAFGEQNIVYGILEDNLVKCLEGKDVEYLLIAKGQEAVDDSDDILDIKFKDKDLKKLDEDSTGSVDFKSIGFVNSIEKGSIIAIKKEGTAGIEGKNIYGQPIKKKTGKKIKIMLGDGCLLKEDNTVVASKGGKPCVSGNKFSVFDVHEVNSDVDITTGNIKFSGDIIIYGDIKEGMIIESGHNVTVLKNMLNSKIISKGDVSIHQNVIYSTIFAGGEDVIRLKELDIYSNLSDNILNLVEAVKQVKSYNLLGEDTPYGEIVKVLIESKFKKISKLCSDVLADNDNEDIDVKVIGNILRDKLLGLGPLKIKNLSELTDINSIIQDSITQIKGSLAVPVSVDIGYLQDSTVQSSGSIIISGKGQYVSKIIANDYVRFLNPASISRGGFVKAVNEVRCGTIGSIGGVSTKIMVGEKGNIYAEKVYQNTKFYFGNKEYTFENPCKQVHAYFERDGEIIVEKMAL